MFFVEMLLICLSIGRPRERENGVPKSEIFAIYFRARARGTYRKGCRIGRKAFLRDLRAARFPFFHFPSEAISQKSRSCGAPARAQRSGSRGERRRSEMSELSALAGSEGYGACADERVLGISLTSQASKMTVFRFQ